MLLLCSTQAVNCQTQANSTEQTPGQDTVVSGNTVIHPNGEINNDVFVMSDSLAKQPAPTVQKAQPTTYWKPSPSRAMWFSVLCPGLGQIYNRSYWKVPVIYGSGAVFAYLVSWQGRMYKDYSNAYYDFMDNDPNTKSYESIFRNLNGSNDWKAKTLKQKRDYYRKYRDLCMFGVGLLYVLNILDAFVDGHLYDFNVSEDLSLHVEPVLNTPYTTQSNYLQYNSTLVGLQCSVSF